jgi:dihydroneopterin aldolase
MMKLKSSTIFIDSLRLHAYHGVMEQERHVGADFCVSLRVHYNIDKAIQTDQLEHTLSYADLCRVVTEQMNIPSALLEHVSGRIARQVMDSFDQVTGLWIRIVKQNPPMGADCDGAGVEAEFER